MKNDELDHILCDYEMAEYTCLLLDYLQAQFSGCPVRPGDARFFLDEKYFPDHPVMTVVRELRCQNR
jgi:hypothetical protein